MRFRLWLENTAALLKRQVSNQPFEIDGRPYVLQFSSVPTSQIFPYSPFGGGYIVEIVWFPTEAAGKDYNDRWGRTGGNTISHVRSVIAALPPMILRWVTENKPVGFFWKGDDSRLASVWSRVQAANQSHFQSLGYVPSSLKPQVYVRQDLKKILDDQSDY